ncbi:MAG TPA: response regulator, partial [Desulfobulbus sp.]|nr:response regulator [Desulfobulbus sp.]
TTIKVLFPVTEDAIPRSDSLNGCQGTDWLAGGVVLLVDDEETVRSVGRQMLELLGLQVIVAENGRQAVAVYDERGEEIDLVLLDLSMPHMDGIQAFRELRRLDRTVRVVMSSGYNEQEVTRQVVGKGLAGFIQKPYQIETLRDVLTEVLAPDREPGE